MIDRKPLIAAAVLAILGTVPSAAYAQDAHAGHHPAEKPTSTAPSAAAPAATKQDMMMGGTGEMKGPQGMMGKMGDSNMPMMGDRGMPMMCMGGGMGMPGNIEERINALRTELKITSAQSSLWNSFADVLRANAANMGKLHDTMMTQHQGGTPLTPMQRLDLHDRALTAAHDSLRALKPVLTRLYTGLSAEQRKKADILLMPHDGMMQGMPMSGMRNP